MIKARYAVNSDRGVYTEQLFQDLETRNEIAR